MLVYLCFGVGCPLPGITASASGYHEIALLFSAVLLFLLIDWLSA